MKRTLIDELAERVFASIERDNPLHDARTREIIASEYANNELMLMIALVKRLKSSHTITDRKNLKKLDVIERELWNMAEELVLKI